MLSFKRSSISSLGLACAAISSSSFATTASASKLSLSELQHIAHTGLNDELTKITNAAIQREENARKAKEGRLLPYQRARCDDDDTPSGSTYMRRRAPATDNDIAYSSEQVWSL